MLNLVTDQRPGEPDVLSAVKHAAFEIRSLAGDVLLAIAAPPNGLDASAADNRCVRACGNNPRRGRWLPRRRMDWQ